MHISLSIDNPVAVLALIFGVMIIVMPKLTRVLVGAFLILFGLIELFNVRF